MSVDLDADASFVNTPLKPAAVSVGHVHLTPDLEAQFLVKGNGPDILGLGMQKRDLSAGQNSRDQKPRQKPRVAAPLDIRMSGHAANFREARLLHPRPESG